MKTEVPSFLALILSLLTVQIGAQAQAGSRPLCESAFAGSVVPTVALPGDYRLSAHDYAYALELPQARQLTTAVRDAIEFIEEIAVRKIDILRFKPLVNGSENTDQHQEPRAFPRAFFQANFGQPPFVKNPADITQIEKRYNDLAVEFANERISDEVLLVLAIATRRLPETKYDGSEDYRPYDDGPTTIKTFVTNAANLPTLVNFMFASDPIFVEYAAINRGFVASMVKVEVSETDGRQAYKERLSQALKAAGKELSMDEKVALSIKLLEPGLTSYPISIFKSAMAKRDRASNKQKWVTAGHQALTNLMTKAYRAAEAREPSSRAEYFKFVKEALFDFAGNREGEAYDLLVTIMQELMRSADSRLKTEIQSTRNQIVNDITPVILLIKQAVREDQKAIRTAQHEQERAVSLQRGAKLAAPVLSNKPNTGRPTQGPSLTGSVKAAMEKAATDPSNDSPKAQDAPSFVAPEGPALADVTINNVIPGVSYWFNSAETFRINMKSGVEVQDASRYIMHVQFSRRVIDEIKAKRLDLQAWMTAFLRGPTANSGASGLKKLNALDGLSWEIKILPGQERIAVRLDPDTKKLWIWEKTGDHKEISKLKKTKKRK